MLDKIRIKWDGMLRIIGCKKGLACFREGRARRLPASAASTPLFWPSSYQRKDAIGPSALTSSSMVTDDCRRRSGGGGAKSSAAAFSAADSTLKCTAAQAEKRRRAVTPDEKEWNLRRSEALLSCNSIA